MTKPMVRIHNTATDEVLDREMTDAEFKVYEAEQTAMAKADAEIQAKATAKAELLKRMGLTADEAALLLA